MPAKGCKKCDPHEICEECPEWIFTLADLIMCMMGLFVILWVLKPSPDPKQNPEMNAELIRVIAQIREAFGYLPDPKSTDPIDLEILARKIKEMKPTKGPGAGAETTVPKKGAEGDQPNVMSIRNGPQSIVGTRVMFAAGSADLSAEQRRVLDEIVRNIKGHRNVVLVKGHTSLDDLPDGATAQQKLELSIRRAQVAADYLTAAGVEPEILRVLGCSTFEPVAQRAYNGDAKGLNRRVEVEATNLLVSDVQDAAPPVMTPAE